jgi:hypothetical protein
MQADKYTILAIPWPPMLGAHKGAQERPFDLRSKLNSAFSS